MFPSRRESPPLPKLQDLAFGAIIRKRPLLRRQAHASKCPIIHVSAKMPFMAIKSRAVKHLEHALRNHAAAPRNATLQSRIAALGRSTREAGPSSSSSSGSSSNTNTAVQLLATGRAIEKATQVAGYFMQRSDCTVHIRTMTTTTVDDILDPADVDDADESCFGHEGKTRLRNLNILEICIDLK